MEKSSFPLLSGRRSKHGDKDDRHSPQHPFPRRHDRSTQRTEKNTEMELADSDCSVRVTIKFHTPRASRRLEVNVSEET